ncbi:MAG: hypothetical protein U9Q18_03655 [Caldisericota bacterium]|nr:hypothetical protein [Caldisericota bacterium]
MERVKSIITDALSDTFVEALKAKITNIYIVGGAIRDAFYGKDLKDFDFIVKENDFEKVLDFFENSNLKYFLLNAKDFLFLRTIQGDYTFDFMKITNSIDDNLMLRDYTINAVCYSLSEKKFFYRAISLKDLEDRVLRSVSPTSISEDPVRVLRGIRLATEFGLSIDEDTREQIKSAFFFLKSTKKERRREELKKILDLDVQSVLKVLEIFFPGKNFSFILKKINLSMQFNELDKEINRDFTYRDAFIVALFSYVFLEYPVLDILGLSRKEAEIANKIVGEKVEDSFDSLFSLFTRYRSICIPLAAALFSLEGKEAAKASKFFVECSNVKIDGSKLGKKFNVEGKELGVLKGHILAKECKKLYEKF